MIPFFLKLLIYTIYLPEQEIKVKAKNLMSPWITKCLVKSFKRKQTFEIFKKKKICENEK